MLPVVRYGGGQLHGFPVPDELMQHYFIEVTHADGEREVYQRIEFVHKELGLGATIYMRTDYDEDEMAFWAMQIVNPC